MSGLRLVIVEDEFIVAFELSKVLASIGHDVCFVASSGEDAVEAARDHRPDCVLMDVNIAGTMGGIEAAAEIRRRLDTEIVFMTGLPGHHLEQLVREIRPAAILAKPIDHASLHELLDRIAAQRRVPVGAVDSSDGDPWRRGDA